MDALLPLLAGCCPPHRWVPRSRQNDQTAGAKDMVACATATAKVVDGKVAQAMAKSSAMTNALGLVAWWQRGCNNVVVAATHVSSFVGRNPASA